MNPPSTLILMCIVHPFVDAIFCFIVILKKRRRRFLLASHSTVCFLKHLLTRVEIRENRENQKKRVFFVPCNLLRKLKIQDVHQSLRRLVEKLKERKQEWEWEKYRETSNVFKILFSYSSQSISSLPKFRMRSVWRLFKLFFCLFGFRFGALITPK